MTSRGWVYGMNCVDMEPGTWLQRSIQGQGGRDMTNMYVLVVCPQSKYSGQAKLQGARTAHSSLG